MNAPEAAVDPATILNVIIQQASEKVAYAESMLAFARALEHHMQRYTGDGTGGDWYAERHSYAINQIEQKLKDHNEWDRWREFKNTCYFRDDGFCAASVAVARLMLVLAGPEADVPMTQQRMKRMMRTFPSWSSPSSDADPDLVRGREDAIIERDFSVEFIHAATLCPSDLPPLSGETGQVQSAESVKPTKPFHRTNEQQKGQLANADKNELVCVASFLEPCDMLHLALTCRRLGDKEYNIAAVRQGHTRQRVASSWSLMEEVARCLVEANQRDGDKEILRLARCEGESWLGTYQELVLFQSLQKNGVDVLKQKLEYISTCQVEWSSLEKATSLKLSGQLEVMEDVYLHAHRHPFVIPIMAPNENPEGLDDDEDWEHPDHVSSVEDQIKYELNDFPFLDT